MLKPMYSFALAQTGAAEVEWAKAQAARDLDTAATALDDARAALTGLAADTEWDSGGVRAMHEAIADFERRASAESSEARDRESEVARIEAT